MDSFDELKLLWKRAKAIENFVASQAKQRVIQYRLSKVKRISFLIAMMSITYAIICFVFVNYSTKYYSTYIGVACIATAVFGAILWQISMLSLFIKPVDMSVDNKSFLSDWYKYQIKQTWMHRIGISIYFLLLSVGLAFYLFEFAERNWRYGVLFYAITAVWIGINWFYFRPRVIKKQTREIENTIEELKRLSKQLDDNS